MNQIPESSQLQFHFSPQLKRFSFGLIVIGLLLVLAQVVFSWEGEWTAGSGESIAKAAPDSLDTIAHHGNKRLFFSIHLALLFSLPLAIGGIYFIALHHLSGAFWSVSVRRLAEHSLWYFPIIAILMGVVFLGSGDIFHHWVHAPADDLLIELKKPWLNLKGFIIRNLVILIAWFLFGWVFLRKSLKQDKDASVSHTRTLVKYSAGFMVFFALSYSVSSWDLSLSLEPHWFSTIWAAYSFSGAVLTIFASLVLWVCYLKSKGYYGKALNENHLHDLGKYIWGHSIFWAYMAISQYLLIWYAAIPEETVFFKTRTEGNWLYVSFILVILRFVLPFFLLMKRDAKRSFKLMAWVSVLILVGQLWDAYWIAYPTMIGDGAGVDNFVFLSWQELGPLCFVIGTYIFILAKRLSKHNLIPIKDPRLDACLAHHQ